MKINSSVGLRCVSFALAIVGVASCVIVSPAPGTAGPGPALPTAQPSASTSSSARAPAVVATQSAAPTVEPAPSSSPSSLPSASASSSAHSARAPMPSAEVWKGLTPPPAAMLSCKSDAECVGVEIGCCDHCNSGRVLPAAKNARDQVEHLYKPAMKCAKNLACTTRACMGPDPICNAGVCGLAVHPSMFPAP
ncbi:MAG: hypothetical protein U0165_16660 [Polyangiaceae bacterium]